MNQVLLRRDGGAGSEAGRLDATSGQVITSLYDCALEKVSEARIAIEHRNNGSKSELLSSAIAIIDGIRESLDFERGGEVAFTLAYLYDYIERLLVEANVLGDPTLLDEVGIVLEELKSGRQPEPSDMRLI